MKKVCLGCGIEKEYLEFYADKHNPTGRTSRCKVCQKKYEQENREKINARKVARYKIYRGKKYDTKEYREYNRKWYAANKEKISEQRKRRIHKTREWRNKRRREDISYRLHTVVGNALRYIIGGKRDRTSWTAIIGYTGEELKRHLEKKFLPGMTWENYGKEWHIDHIIPVSAFNITSQDDIDLRRCWALKNLRPLWKKDNLSKGDRLERPFQPCLAIAI